MHMQVAFVLSFLALHGVHVVSIVASLVGLPQCVWLHVSGWLRLIEMFAAVSLGVSCFLSCRVKGYYVAR